VFGVGGYALISFLLNFRLVAGDVKNFSLLGTIRSNPTSCSSIMPLINFLSYTCLITPVLFTSGMRNTLRFFGILPFPAFIPDSFIHDDTKLLLSFFLAFRLLILAFFVIRFNMFSYFVLFMGRGFLGGECTEEVPGSRRFVRVTTVLTGGIALVGHSCPLLGVGRMG